MIDAMSAPPEMATFARLVNNYFRLHLAGGATVEVELVELRKGSSHSAYEQFSLVFGAPVETAPEQRIYALEHADTGPFELFLVPIGRTDSGLLLEAVINRSVEPAAGG